MGYSYINLILATSDTAAIAAALTASKRTAFISPPHNNVSVIYDQACDELDVGQAQDLSAWLSGKLGCVALAILIQHDDILSYWLYKNGQQLDAYCSNPNYFDTEPGPQGERGGDVGILCEALGLPAAATDVQRILHGTEFVFEHERHQALADALNQPPFSVCCSYRAMAEGYRPEGLNDHNVTAVG